MESDQPQPPSDNTPADPSEAHADKRRRHARRVGLYLETIALAITVVVLVALIRDNTRTVRVDWIVGSGDVSLVWLILAVAIVAYFLGMLTSLIFRRRTRRRTR